MTLARAQVAGKVRGERGECTSRRSVGFSGWTRTAFFRFGGLLPRREVWPVGFAGWKST